MVHFSWQYPWAVQIGSIHLLWHVILEYLAFFIGFRYYVWLRRKKGDVIESEKRLWILVGAIAGALIGSRLVGGLENISHLRAAPNKLMYFYGNKTVVGGFIGGLFGVEGIKKIIGEKNNSGDLFVYPMILALFIGRIGCAGMGIYEDVYGIPTRFFMGMDLGDGIRRHPLVLYEMIYLPLLWVSISWIAKNFPLANGSKFKLFMMGYLLFRFCIEFLKARETYFLGLGAIQLACLICLLYYWKYFASPKKLLAVPVSDALYFGRQTHGAEQNGS